MTNSSQDSVCEQETSSINSSLCGKLYLDCLIVSDEIILALLMLLFPSLNSYVDPSWHLGIAMFYYEIQKKLGFFLYPRMLCFHGYRARVNTGQNIKVKNARAPGDANKMNTVSRGYKLK